VTAIEAQVIILVLAAFAVALLVGIAAAVTRTDETDDDALSMTGVLALFPAAHTVPVDRRAYRGRHWPTTVELVDPGWWPAIGAARLALEAGRG
jgi:hypothetical protein